MSFAEWKKIYYPIDAKDVPQHLAAVYSHLKWTGVQPNILAAFGLIRENEFIYEAGEHVFTLDAGSCPLCTYYISQSCRNCSLNAAQPGSNRKCTQNSTYGKVLVDSEPVSTLVGVLLEAITLEANESRLRAEKAAEAAKKAAEEEERKRRWEIKEEYSPKYKKYFCRIYQGGEWRASFADQFEGNDYLRTKQQES